REFKRGLELASRNPELHYNLGLAFKLKDDLPAALAELRQAEALNPNLPDPAYTLGVTLWQMGNFEASAAELQKVLAIKPDYAEAYYTLGTVWKQMGKLSESERALRTSIRLQPDFSGAHTTLAAVLKQQGNIQEAEEENHIANSIRETKMGIQAATFATNSGIRLLNAGDLTGAISQFETAIKAFPNYLPAHQQLATALERAGDKKRSLEEAKVVETLRKSQ
ncbi:MAG TPA: tetratricopeptide repeat protein, partial [Candidatus Sulfotelmatobacter sp.]|nr:tetratricopeptide repeat protein [Candidatus Sulfotelmatobacter sp.]